MARSKKATGGAKATTSSKAKQQSPIAKSPEQVENADKTVPPSPTTSPPQRKRRMASLNAEFFVRYSSSSYKHTTSPKKSEAAKKLNASTNSGKRKRSIARSVASTKENSEIKAPVVKKSPRTSKATKKKTPVKAKKQTAVSGPVIEQLEASGRPKREAGARASAMIIQTSEIEKSRFFSNAKKEQEVKDNDQMSKSTEEPPKAIPIAKKRESAVKQSKKEPIKKTKKSLAAAAAVVMSRSSSNSESDKSTTPTKVYNTLTEAYIKEHNSHHGSLARGGGSSFTSSTKMYIVKWTMENVMTDEAPFENEIIDIETFGTKILDDPQYLKSKQSRALATNKQPENKPDKSVVVKRETPTKETPALKSPAKKKVAEEETTEQKKALTPKRRSTQSAPKINESPKKANETPAAASVKKTTENEDQKSVGTSLSESVHLVVDETPAVESSIEKPEEEATVAVSKTESVDKVLPDTKMSEEVAEQSKDVKDVIENSENLVEVDKTDKQVADVSPVKPEKPLQKTVLNTVTAKANIGAPQSQSAIPHDIKQTVLSELMNESSNTNYSMDD